MNTISEERVLIVDEPDGREVLKLELEMAGYQVDLADDGEAGLLVAAARAPDAAIIDQRAGHRRLVARRGPVRRGWRTAPARRRDHS